MTNNANQQEVAVPVQSNRWFKATLLLPESKKPVAAVVMIPGFVPGANSRGEEAWREPSVEDSGATLARYLTQLGFAVLRVPIGDFAAGGEPPQSLDSLADRALGGVQYLRKHTGIKSAPIGIIGQSAGGFVAAIAAARSKDLAFLVTLATPMDSIDRTFDEVLDRLLRAGEATEKERTAIRKQMRDIFHAAAKGANAETLRPAVEDFLRAEYAHFPKQQRQMAAKDVDEFVRKLLDDHVRDLTTPMYRTMIGYDVGQTLRHVSCPMLILFAENDIKVEPTRGSEMARTLVQNSGQANGTVQVINGANHFFEKAGQESPSASPSPEQRFPSGFLVSLKTWLLKCISLPPQ